MWRPGQKACRLGTYITIDLKSEYGYNRVNLIDFFFAANAIVIQSNPIQSINQSINPIGDALQWIKDW